ncbi:MAG: hypothetical protein PF508_11010 [Spirochaeta sp.]|nr:hypothetical protein [Spirochaeta sp.]
MSRRIQAMASRNYLTTATLNEIVRYDDEARYERETISFEGAVRKHPYDTSKFLLITHPGDADSHFYEFRVADVVRAHDISQVVSENGETVQLMELRVRKGSHGIEMKPFQVS